MPVGDKVLSRPMALLCLLLILHSCSSEFSEIEKASSLLDSQTKKDQMARDFAEILSKSLKNPAVRSFVKNEASKKFDGDNNFIFQLTKDAQIENIGKSSGKIDQKSFSQILMAEFNSAAGRTGADGNAFMKSLEENFPLMQISIPTLPTDSLSNWDTDSVIPLVAVITSNMGDEITAYDSEGDVHKLSVDTPPARLVIVVSENERVIAVEKGMKKSNSSSRSLCEEPIQLYSDDTHNYYYRSDYYDAINNCEIYSGGGGTSGGTGPVTCDRDTRNNKDELVGMKFASISDFNFASQWFDGGLDIEVTATFASANGQISKVTKFISGPDRDFRNCPFPGFTCKPAWKGIHAEIVTWDKTIYGDAMHYFWVEKDPGSTTSYTTSFNTSIQDSNGATSTINSGLTFTITDGDDLLGEAIVEYCDKANNEGYEYSTGRIKFNVREK